MTYRSIGLTLVIAASSTAFLHGCHKRDNRKKHYYCVASNGAALEKGAPVFIAGVPVGKIVRRTVTHDNQARIEFKVDRRHKIYANASVRIKRVSAACKRYLEIYPGRPLSPNPSAPGGPPIKNRLLTHGSRIIRVNE